MTDTEQLVVWLRAAMDAEAGLAQRVAARHTASHDERVPEEQRGKPFWPLAGARHRYEEFAPGKKWSDPDLYAGLTLIETYSPQRVLRRIAADRKTLAEHEATAADFDGTRRCLACGGYTVHPGLGTVGYRTVWPCPTIRNLAEGWGWTEETP